MTLEVTREWTLDGARERYENPTGLEQGLTSDETDIRFW